mgnify:CR=1 FL=1|tara:strand:+ start:36474 stop:37853 length:1380 start_codon:yes stop_codon:yes gene_type:complete
MPALQFKPIYTGKKKDQEYVFQFCPKNNEWVGTHFSLVKKDKWYVRYSDGVTEPCKYDKDENFICADISFPDLNIAKTTKTSPKLNRRMRNRISGVSRGGSSKTRWSLPKIPGVGACLASRIEGFLATKESGGCGCVSFAAKMDAWGPLGCEQNREVIVNHLIANAPMLSKAVKKLDIPGSNILSIAVGAIPRSILRIGADRLLTKSIEDAKKEQLKRITNIPLPSPEPFPFTSSPKFIILSHLYPLRGSWKHHSERLSNLPMDIERKVLGVSLDNNTDSLEEVKEVYKDWEIFEFENNTKLREVVSYRKILPDLIENDTNQIILCHHHKGVQPHNVNSEPITWWVDAMYKTVFENPEGIIKAMSEGASIVGSFRRKGRMLNTRFSWHFSGTFYAIRSARVHPVDSFTFRDKWWGTESWPGDYFPLEHSACLFGDDSKDLYKVNQQPRKELEVWLKENR